MTHPLYLDWGSKTSVTHHQTAIVLLMSKKYRLQLQSMNIHTKEISLHLLKQASYVKTNKRQTFKRQTLQSNIIVENRI